MGGFSDSEARAIVADLEAFFSANRRRTVVAIFNAAWRIWIGSILRYLPDCPKRTRRAVMWTLLLNEARTRFGDDLDIVFKETRHGHFFLLVPGAKSGGSILLRFKFLDEDLHTRNYPTQTAIEYNQQMPLPGIPPGIRVDVGYRPNQDETALNGVFAVWSVGSQKLWVLQLDGAQARVIADIPLPIAASRKPAQPPRRTKVKGELSKKKKDQDPTK